MRFEQAAGAHNALGRVKFLFPNTFSVYVHDTPERSLFERETRALSSGCVRVQNPRGLASALLGDPWDAAAIDAQIEGARERSVALPAPVPIHLVYWTARVGADGSLQIFEDLYGLDELAVAPPGS